MVSMAMMMGIKRGLFSNEAGMGSAPNAAAASDVKHPVNQGLVQMLGVFVDTFVVCSCTAIIILASGLYHDAGFEGVALTQMALESQIGSWGDDFLATILFLFAFSSVIQPSYRHLCCCSRRYLFRIRFDIKAPRQRLKSKSPCKAGLSLADCICFAFCSFYIVASIFFTLLTEPV